MKILFINLPYYGHVVPTIGLVQELIKKGCQVTYALPFDWETRIEGSGATFLGYENHKELSSQIRNAYKAAEKVIEEYDLVIYEQFFFLGKHLAEKYDKPVVRIFTAPVTNEKLMYEYVNAGGALGIFKHKWIGKIWTKKVAKGIPLKTDCWLSEIVQNPTELNLVYTSEEYQPYVNEFPKSKYKFLGALVYDRKETFSDLEKKERPLIYISLGTIVNSAVPFFRKCMEAFQDEEVDVIMSVGKKIKLEKLGEIPRNFLIYNTVSQQAVLKKADVFVTHGGMNSVSEAMVEGVPMVVIPFMADQPTNARRVCELGLGKKLEYKNITSEMLRETVWDVLKDDTISECVIRMKEKMSKCLGNKGGAEEILHFYNKGEK